MRYTAVGDHTMGSVSMLTGVLHISLLLFLAPTIYGQYRHGDVRLVGGSYQWEGRVEIYLSGTWGTITDSEWSRDDAQVVCRKLGHYKPGATSHSGAYFGEGKGTIHWDSVQCSGSEYSITYCDAENTGTRTSHSFDVGVKCQPADGSYREGDIRLVGGSYNWEGRVEIYWSGAWGTVSDSTWTIPDAVVVCRQLAHSEVGGYLAHYGEGSGAVSIRDVMCSGTEHNITSCVYYNDTVDDSHSDDVGVQCQQGDGAKEGDIRLVGGTVSWQGRVEIYLSGVWGTIVDDSATSHDAQVVCRQLGYNTYTARAQCCAGFGQGSGPILVDDLDCYGSEYRLSDCQYHNNTDDDTHYEDWGVICYTDGPESGDVRLTHTYYGSVQVFLSGSWVFITTTHYPWTVENAQVVCRELGYLTTDPTVHIAGDFHTAPENGVKVNNVVCNGSEPRLLNCPHQNLTNLSDYAAAAMECQRATNCTNWDVRLAGRGDEMEGRVEICSSYRWGTVCGSQWTHNHTAVVCRRLGFSDEEGDSSFFTSEMFGEGTGPVLMDFVNCTGSEPKLSYCRYFTHYYGCSHSDDVGVHCQPAHCADGQIELIQGSSERDGRVEICFNQRWGTIADDSWDYTDCTVACQELGYESPYYCSDHIRGGGPIHRTDFQCTGSEQRLSQCSSSNDTLLKSHDEDVGIRCSASPCADGEVRLVEGESAWEGRLEVCFSQRWGTVSSDGWSHTNTRVVCNDLGYDFTDKVNMSIPQSLSKPVFLRNVVCSKTDLNLLECSFSKYTGNINRVQDAIVNCELPTCSDGDLKLVGGDSEREGRLEVCFDQRWGTINADGWTETDTQVACRQLGYSTSDVSFSIRQRKISSPSLPVHMTLVGCYSSDEKLTDCAYHEYTSSGNHHMDISVDCGSSTTESELNAVTVASLSIAVFCILAVFMVVVVILVIFFTRRRKEKYNNRNQRDGTLGITERTTRNTDMNERYSGNIANINYFNQQVSKSTDDKQTAEEDIPLDNYEEMEPEYSPPHVVQTATKQQTRPKPAAKKPVAAPSTKIRYSRNRQLAKKPPAPAPAMVPPPKVQPRYQPPSRSPSPEAIYEVPD